MGTFKKYELNFPDCAAMAGKKAVWVNEDCDKELKALYEEWEFEQFVFKEIPLKSQSIMFITYL